MKISVDDVELYSLTTTQENVIKYTINSDIFTDDMKRRLQYILIHKYEQSLEQLKDDWEPVIASRYTTIPSNINDFLTLVFSQVDYKDKKARDEQII